MNDDLLSQLAPPHAPPPVGWWPLAPGWWIVTTLLLLCTTGLVFWWRQNSFRLRRTALRELALLETRSDDDIALARGIEHLLRRYAVARFGREAVARLSGEAWIDFIAHHGGESYKGEVGRSLLSIAYGAKAHADRKSWLSGARRFLQRAKP